MTDHEWDAYRRSFSIHLDAIGLHGNQEIKTQGRVLFANMGQETIKGYDPFYDSWASEVEAKNKIGLRRCGRG